MNNPSQLITFWLNSNLYGVDVQSVQEVTQSMSLTIVPLAPKSIAGLLNLRGQIATAITLQNLFYSEEATHQASRNFVICRSDSNLVALVVDEIGDVIEVQQNDFEETPHTVPESIRNYAEGVYKLEDKVLTLVKLDKILEFINRDN